MPHTTGCTRDAGAFGLRNFVTRDALQKPDAYEADLMSMHMPPMQQQQMDKMLARTKVGADPVSSSIRMQMAANERLTQDPSSVIKAYNARVTGSDVLRIGNPGLMNRACGGNQLGTATSKMNVPRYTSRPEPLTQRYGYCEDEQVVGNTFTGFAYGRGDLACKRMQQCLRKTSDARALVRSSVALRPK